MKEDNSLAGSFVGNLAMKYWEQRIGFIDEHFKILENKLTDIIDKFDKVAGNISIKLKSTKNCSFDMERFVDEGRKLPKPFIEEIGHYLEKVQFKNPPDYLNKNDDDSHGFPSLGIETQELDKYYKEMCTYYKITNDGFECTKAHEILNTVNSLQKKLLCIYERMICATQTQREQVFDDALAKIANTIVNANANTKAISHENVEQPITEKLDVSSSNSGLLNHSSMFRPSSM